MKGAKELADKLRQVAEYDWRLGCAFREWADIAAHLDAKAAIDSAVPSDANEIEYRWGKSHGDISTLLAIVQRQAGELIETRRARDAANERLEAARAEVERLEALVDEFKAASMLDVNGDPDGVTPRLLEGHVTALQTEVDRLQAERAALAQENARLINEVGELHAKLAAPSVDMTPGMQPRAMRESAGCHAGTDGDCYWSECPQIMDGEPHKSGRSCPLCNSADDS